MICASSGVRSFVPGIRARLPLALAAALAAACGAEAADPTPREVLAPLVAAVLATPEPVAQADGRIHLAYELTLVNPSDQLVTLTTLEVLDPEGDGAPLAALADSALARSIRVNGRETGAVLGPSHSGVVFLDVSFASDAPVPREIVHRFSLRTRPRAAPLDDHHGGDPDPAGTNLVAFLGAPSPVERRAALVVEPPVDGPGWVAAEGCCKAITSHRGATLSIDGKIHAAERFAIDFVRIQGDGMIYTGDRTKVGSYAYFGVPVRSVAAGVVASTQDGQPEQTPGTAPSHPTLQSAGGNYVVVDVGGGRFAFYAHMQPGSLRVAKGDHVRAGQVIGLLGNSGNSDAPHLHFHMMDGPSPLASNGVPFAFASFEGQGVVTSEDALFDGKPAPVDRGALAGPHANQLPLNLQIVGFPEVRD